MANLCVLTGLSVFCLGYGIHTSSGTERARRSTPQWTYVQRTIEDPSLIKGDGVEEAFDHIDSLSDCEKEQSPRSMSAMAKHYSPSKFGWSSDGIKYGQSYYQNVYPKLMERYRTKVFRMVEIGLDKGAGSLLWQEYFPCAEIYGIEYAAVALHTAGAESINTYQGDQQDEVFLRKFVNETGGGFSLIIDDGGHHPEQQLNSYKVLFEQALLPGGTYIIEDIETSYWYAGQSLYGKDLSVGGVDESRTVVNKFRQAVHVVNRKFYDNNYTAIGNMDHWIKSVSFAMNLIILQKKSHADCFTEDFYIWPGRLTDQSPAKHQGMQGDAHYPSPLKSLCAK